MNIQLNPDSEYSKCVSELHNTVMDLFVNYLRMYAGIDKMIYAPDPA